MGQATDATGEDSAPARSGSARHTTRPRRWRAASDRRRRGSAGPSGRWRRPTRVARTRHRTDEARPGQPLGVAIGGRPRSTPSCRAASSTVHCGCSTSEQAEHRQQPVDRCSGRKLLELGPAGIRVHDVAPASGHGEAGAKLLEPRNRSARKNFHIVIICASRQRRRAAQTLGNPRFGSGSSPAAVKPPLHQHPHRAFDQRLERREQFRAERAVDHAVIAGQASPSSG